MKQSRKPIVSRGRVAVLAVLACGAFLGSSATSASAQVSILNTTSVGGQTSWLTSFTTVGEDNRDPARTLRLSMVASHPTGTNINTLRTDDDWDGSSFNSADDRGVSAQIPTIDGGYPRSRVDFSYLIPTSNTGFSCPFIGTATRRTDNRVFRIRARSAAGQESSTSNSTIKFVASGQCNAHEDWPHIFAWGSNFGDDLTPGQSKTFSYQCDDRDTSGDEDCQGVRWRVRDVRTGAIVQGPSNSCPNNGDNATKNLNVTFPDRGLYVVEGELSNESCMNATSPGYWFHLGWVDVNSSAAPSLSLDSAATTVGGVVRPQFGQDWTVRAQGLADPDSGDQGGAQILEWDLNNNTGDGANGFEETNYSDYQDTLDVGDTSGTDATQRSVDSSGQSPGLYTVRARVTDNGAIDAADSIRRRSGNVSLQYRVDAAPNANTQTVNTDTNASALPITLTGSDPDGDSLTYSITDSPDHGSLGGSGASRTYTPTAGYAGTDSFTFQVDDGFGRTDTAVVSINVRPNTTITDQPALLSNDSTPTFQFNSNGSPVTFQCKLDTGAFTACSSPHTYGTLADGLHTFEVRAVATTGSVVDPSPDTYTWTIDATAPNTQIDDSPPTVSNSASASFEFSAPGDPGATFECRLDNDPGGFTSCTSPQSYTSLGEGAHTFEVRATDAASNTDQSPASFTWTVDTIGPTVTLDTFPNDPTNDPDASFSFHANESVTGFECELDGGGFSSCSSPAEYPGLGDGSHTFSVRATDTAGNTGDAANFTWVIDSTPPTTSIDTSPDALENSTMADFTYSSNESPVNFQCKLDSGPFVPCNTQPQSYAGLAQGSHTFQVFATDAAGNSDSSPATFTWIVDTIAPGTSIDEGSVTWPPPGVNHPNHRTTSQDADFDFFGSNDANPPVTFECRLDSSLEADFQACTAPVHYTGLNDGPHKFEVRAKDAAGNVDQTPDTYQWNVHNGLPDTLLTDFPDDPTNSTAAHFEFDSSIPDSTFQCSLDGAPLATCTSPRDYTVTEGTHTFEVVATDEFGRDDPSPATYSWTVDLTAPDTVIDDTPLNPSNSDSASFTFHSTEPGSTLECQLDGGGWTVCDESLPQDYNGLSDGSHTFEVRATDAAGNLDQTPASYTWVVDTQAPSTTIDDQPTDPSRIVDPTFQFSSNEDPNVEFFCTLDTELEVPCDTDYQLNNLTEGTHTFSVYAVDEAGNVGDPASYTWYVDLTPPDTSITDQPALLTNSASATFQFEGMDNYSNAVDLTFECRLNSTEESDFQPCSSGDSFTGVEGTNTFDVRALDAAGNWDPSPASYEWVVDLTGPDTEITDQPPLLTNSGSAVFEFSGTDNHSDPGDLTFECQIDGNGFSPCTSGADFGPIPEGTHTFEVRAIDEVVNVDSTPATYTWTVDLTEPDTSITDQPADPTNASAAVFEFDGSDNHSAAGDLTFECQLDGGGFNDCTSGSDFGPVGDGTHTFEVRATDQAGNTDSTPALFTWMVDQGAPETTITGSPLDPTGSTAAVFEFDSSESGSSFECELDGSGFAPCTSGTDFGPVGQGDHTFKVRATDGVGNTDPSPAEYAWTVDLSEPETTITDQPVDPTNSTAAAFQFEATDNHSDAGDLTFECELDGAGFGACSSGDDFGPVGAGSHTFKVRAIDEVGNVEGTPAEYQWTVDVAEPDTSITDQPANPTNTSNAVFEFTGTDNHSAPGDLTFECQVDGGGFNACNSGDDLGPVNEGSHTVLVRASDPAGNVDSTPATYTWVVDQTAPGVTVDTGPPTPTNADSGTIEFTVTGSPATVECSLDGAPFTPCTSPQTVTGLSDGSHTFTVKATDAAGNEGTDEWTWTVDTGTPETSISSAPVNPTSVNSASFGFNADEPATFQCQLDSGGFTACTSPQSYTGLTPGVHTFQVRATDTAGNTDPTPATHSWTITAAPQGGVLGAGGGLAPLIERRVRALNVPLAGAFQIASVTCRAGTCSLTEKKAVIKVGRKRFIGTVSIDQVTKQLAAGDSFQKGETAHVIVHFASGVKNALAANSFGSLTVQLTARTDAGGGASDSKKIKLKAKWLKRLLG